MTHRCEQSAQISPSTTASVFTRTLRSPAEIDTIRPVWNSWSQHPNSDFDQYCITLARPEVARPHVVVLYRRGRPDAMLIGRLETHTSELKIGYWSLGRRPLGQLLFNHGGFLGNSTIENVELLVAEVMQSLRRNEAVQALFSAVHVDSELYRYITTRPAFLVRDHFPKLQKHRALQLPPLVEAFYEGLPSKVRRHRKQEANRLLREHPGKVEVRCYRAPGEVASMASTVEQIARTTYHRGMGVGFVDDTETRQRLGILAAHDRLRGYVLYVDDVPCAFWLFTLYRGQLHSAYTGYTPDSARYSAGTFLLLKVIEESCRQGVPNIDFGLGDAWYKQCFANLEWEEASLFLFAPTVTGASLSAFSTLAKLLVHLAEFFLVRTGLISRLKKRWREHLRLKLSAA